MKRKGFTLIELLAVIVVLAIIALIATPIVMNVIERSKKGSAERTAEHYMDAVETTLMRESVKHNELGDGVYNIQSDGSICLDGTDCDETAIKIEGKGDMPSSGSLVIKDGTVVGTDDTYIIIKDYTVIYDDSKKSYVASTDFVIKLCKPVTAEQVTTGNVPVSGQYNYGDEYICKLGDGVSRRFFVLEDGDNTRLNEYKGAYHTNSAYPGYGTAGDGEIALIMNKNLEEKATWCLSGSDKSCNANGAKASLKAQTSNWTDDRILSINLPTYHQIYEVNKSTTLTSTPWLFGVSGYVTSTAKTDSAVNVFVCVSSSGIISAGGVSAPYSIRPVITISKNDL